MPLDTSLDLAVNSVILRLIPEHNDKYEPIIAKLKHSIFNYFYHKSNEKLLYHQLIEACTSEYLKLNITPEEVLMIEKHTRESN